MSFGRVYTVERVIACIGLGFAAQWSVAVALGVFAPLQPAEFENGIARRAATSVRDAPPAPDAFVHGHGWHGFGTRVINSTSVWPDRDAWEAARALHSAPFGMSIPGLYFGTIDLHAEAGIPLASVSGNAALSMGTAPGAIELRPQGVLRRHGSTWEDARLAPIVPRLWASIANTAVFAAALIVPVHLAIAARAAHRRHRGRCVRCAFPCSAGSCPECGLGVPGAPA